jgi:hypothetical protein
MGADLESRRPSWPQLCGCVSLVVPESEWPRGTLPRRGHPFYRAPSGKTGASTRPKVALITAANDAYQAAIAVASPK